MLYQTAQIDEFKYMGKEEQRELNCMEKRYGYYLLLGYSIAMRSSRCIDFRELTMSRW